MAEKQREIEPATPQEIAEGTVDYKAIRDRERENSTELQNEIADVQEAKLGIALRKLMDRTENNPEIINNLNELLDGLTKQATMGNPEKKISGTATEDIAKFLGESAKALRATVGGGNRSATEKIDFSNWEMD